MKIMGTGTAKEYGGCCAFFFDRASLGRVGSITGEAKLIVVG